MDPKVILQNIERRLVVLEISADEASRRAKRPDAIRNLRRKVENGDKGSMRADTLAALAAVLLTTPDELGSPGGSAPPPPASAREYLLAQRDLIDRQLAAIDEAEFIAQRPRKRKNR